MMMMFFLLGLVASKHQVRKHHAKHTHRHSTLFDLSAFYKTPTAGATQEAADGSGADGTAKDAAANDKVFKDGYWYVDCKSDGMYDKGDKFGDGAQRFEGGYTYGTSIVRYDVINDRENQEPMTPQVCFDFCRTIPDMQYFGLTEGRECYCEHFYKTQTGGGVCDLPCEGDSATTCGGQGMSSLYEMHSCEGKFGAEVSTLISDGDDMCDDVDDMYDDTDDARDDMQEAGDALEALADGYASPLAQAAKNAAGPLAKSAQALSDNSDKYTTLETEFKAKKINPASSNLKAADRKAVESMMADLEAVMKESKDMLPGAKATYEAVQPSFTSDQATAAAKTYSAIVPDGGVCGGDLTGQPKVGLSASECAMACDEEAPKSSADYCVGFQYFDGSQYGNKASLCFLFSKVTSLATYECSSFLQTKRGPATPSCMLRHTDFGPAERKVVEA